MDDDTPSGTLNRSHDHPPSPSRLPALPLSRILPHDLNAEESILAAVFIDSAGVLTACASARISSDSFYDTDHQIVFEAIGRVAAEGVQVDVATLATELKFSRQLDQVGGYAALVTISRAAPTTAQTDFFIRRISELEALRSLIRLSTGVVEDAYACTDVGAFLNEHQEALARLANRATPIAATPHRPLFKFDIVKDGDPSILLGNRFVNRGDSFIVVSSSGVGKSSITLQAATLWALEIYAFGIKGHGVIRSLIFQSEDSDGDIAEVALSLQHKLNLSNVQVEQVNANIRVVTDRIHRGAAFLANAKKHIDEFQPDIVWINPLQAFLVGDITKGEDLSKFLREGLNGLNRECKFAVAVVHHTTKPATGKDRADRLWHEVMYDMAGGAELINWARAILSIRPTENEGEFNLVLAKRGKRAGVRVAVKSESGIEQWKYVTTIPLKHSTELMEVPGIANRLPVIFWESRISPESEPSGRTSKAKFDFADYANVFPSATDPGLELAPLHKRLDQNCPIPRKTLHIVLKDWADDGLITVIKPDGAPQRYRKAKP